ncbi:MAG: dihydroneopterin aldolase [Candidatus Poseidonia sp.]|uniref:dihydroneopterin aldolase n=1 Tax=Poseidonia sp. TaxID=2666344 RepID=UPI0030C2177D|nr:dihydroneopterin aldolase [Poseidonia sp.]
MQWRVGLEGYEVRAAHGFYEFEHHAPQPFCFTVWATLEDRDDVSELNQTLNYADIQITIDKVIHEADQPIRLMEEMAQQIIAILSEHAAVKSLSVRIEKPKAPLPHPGGLPVIEVLWQRT